MHPQYQGYFHALSVLAFWSIGTEFWRLVTY